MSPRQQPLPLVALLLPLLTTVALLSSLATPDHVLLGLVLAGVAALASQTTTVPVAVRVGAVIHRSEVCRGTGVRATDPDRPGRVRPRAPGLG